jgi:glucokinase
LTGGLIAAAAAEGNPLAREAFQHAVATFGWAIAQMITLLSPQTVVVGGGVSLAGETIFLGPLREAVERYVFPPSRGTYKIVLAQLGEAVVVHGALAIALEASCVGQAPRT